MSKTALVITSIADQNNAVLNKYAQGCLKNNIEFILIGDTNSPKNFHINGCNFYSIERQKKLNFSLPILMPTKHYSRKNIGYLISIKNNAEVIIETDDDNIPLNNFWKIKERNQKAFVIKNKGWVNVYKHFTNKHIWPRGFALEKILEKFPSCKNYKIIKSPIQQGLADADLDVDAIFRMTQILPLTFKKKKSIGLINGSICPFNSQNTTWFKEAFPLLYLPSYCSFRMTDIWRSFIAQRIAWECDWPILYHSSNVKQKRNNHIILDDFKCEISGYLNNLHIMNLLKNLKLKKGIKYINRNLIECYSELINNKIINKKEMILLKSFLKDMKSLS